MKTFQEVSDQQLELMSDSEKLKEIGRALKWLSKNFVLPEPEDLNRSGYYKLPFNESSVKRWEQNANLQVYFIDIVRRVVKS